MAFQISSSIKTCLRPRLGKRYRSNRSDSSHSSSTELTVKRSKETETADKVPNATEAQLRSHFLAKLPVELRKIIYSYVWEANDRKYHIFQWHGRLSHARCVMSPGDEDPDFIQKRMDQIQEPEGFENLEDEQMRMWYARLVSTWGHRHWRCEERIEDSHNRGCSLRETVFMPMMLVCKLMYPEVMESIFESHTFLFSDLSSAHSFLVLQPSPFIPHLRHLDLTFNLPFTEFSTFIHNRDSPKSNRLFAVLGALSRLICLHDLRISFDVWGRQCWRKLPEQGLVKELKSLRVQKKFVIELPPVLPTEVDCFKPENMADVPFQIERGPPLRYCMFHPPTIERFTWKTSDKDNGLCWISAENIPYVPNPY